MTAGMVEVIAAHVPTTASNTFNAPESGSGRYCRCGHFVRVVHSAMDDSRSTDSYLDDLLAAHVAEELAKAGYGNVSEAKEDAFAEAVAVLRDRSKWTRSEHGPYVVKTGYDEDGHGNAAQDVDEWYADWLEQFPYREPQHG